MNYCLIEPIESPIRAKRQGAKRHYGVHPYFTRRPYNVVRTYILHYSQEGDRVLDPFGGSGVTAIEAFIENRVGIQNDINPLANFIAQGIVDLRCGYEDDYRRALEYLEQRCKPLIDEICRATPERIVDLRDRVNLPPDIRLPRSSDVETYLQLFSPRQLISLAALKDAIGSIGNIFARKAMLLAWSATLAKLNKTFLSAEGRAESRGGSSIFSIYRYKVAKAPVELSPWDTFYERALNVIDAKKEIDKTLEVKARTGGWSGQFKAYSEDVDSLADKLEDSVDYIFTDPPYGGHITYLDLSTLWNSWLGTVPTSSIREQEMIVGGELGFSEDHYIERLGKSIKSCIRMLKKNRWFSVVFQHWNTLYFEAILSAAAESGAELRAAVPQVGDPIWSMHKKKNKDSVLAGELILTFQKTGATRLVSQNGRFDVAKAVGEILEKAIDGRMFGEYLFNRLVIEAWKSSAIRSLSVSKNELTRLLEEQGWRYDDTNHYWVKEERLQLLDACQ